jgi:hypothetical protein
MRIPVALFAAAFAAAALAQSTERPKPQGLTPLLEAPAPPPLDAVDPALEPKVTIRQDGPNKVEEFRVKGKLYAMRVTTPNGGSYMLVDDRGTGQFQRRDGLDTGLRVPQWVLWEF